MPSQLIGSIRECFSTQVPPHRNSEIYRRYIRNHPQTLALGVFSGNLPDRSIQCEFGQNGYWNNFALQGIFLIVSGESVKQAFEQV
jgi:hypothetical protein